ncbi:MAG: DUF4960 domain-containing protein, partial [Bacteroidota bacterium]
MNNQFILKITIPFLRFALCLLEAVMIIHFSGFGQSVKGKSMRMHTVTLTKKEKQAPDQPGIPLIGLVSLLSYGKADTGIISAFKILKNTKDIHAEFLTISDLEGNPKKLNRFSVLWFHRPDTASLQPKEIPDKLITNLKSWTENGGSLFLTQQAVHYLNVLGYEPQALKDSTKSCIDDGYGRKLGFHAFRQHPLFNGLHGGAYLNRPMKD